MSAPILFPMVVLSALVAADSADIEVRYTAPPIEVRAPRAAPLGFPYPSRAVDPRRLGPTAGRDVSDLLDGEPGVRVARSGGPGAPAYLSMRGIPPDGVVVLLDGARLNSVRGGGVDLSLIPIDGVESIEILRGGASLLHGAGAMGGVVSIRRFPARWSAASRASFEIGSLGTVAASGAITRRLPAGWAQLTLRGFRSGGEFGYEDRAGRGESVRLNSGGDSRLIDAIWLNSTRLGALRGGVRISRHRGGSPGLVEFPTPRARRDHDRAAADAGLLGRHGEVALSAAVREVAYRDPAYPLGAIDARHEVMPLGVLAQREERLGPFALTTLVDLRYERLRSTTEGDRARRTAAAAVSARVAGGRGWATHLGARLDALSGFAPAWTPRLGVSKRHRGGRLRAAIGASFRPPGFDDLFWPATGLAVGNPNLRAEHGIDWNVGIDRDGAGLVPAVNLDGFGQSVEELIQWTPGPGGIWRPSNVGRAEIRGVEGSLRWIEARSGTGIELAGTWVEARDRSGGPNTDGRLLPGRPRRWASAKGWRSFGGRALVETAWRAVDSVPRTAANTKFLAGYVVGDVALSVPLGRSVRARAEVQNVAAAEYQDYYGFPLPGRLFRLAVDWRTGSDGEER